MFCNNRHCDINNSIFINIKDLVKAPCENTDNKHDNNRKKSNIVLWDRKVSDTHSAIVNREEIIDKKFVNITK